MREEVAREDAAILIQSVARMRLGKKLRAERERQAAASRAAKEVERKHASDSAASEANRAKVDAVRAAVVAPVLQREREIQQQLRAVREKALKDDYVEPLQAGPKSSEVQSVVKKEREVREQLRGLREQVTRETAAVCVQCAVRVLLAKKVLGRARAARRAAQAAVPVQAMVRGHLARREVPKLKAEREAALKRWVRPPRLRLPGP